MSTFIVTGGAGFIGSHLVQELAERGYRVIVVDDLSTGRIENIRALLDRPSLNVQFIRLSVTDLPALQTLFKDVDYVFHLAAIASVPGSIQDPLSSHQVNLTGTLNVLLAAWTNKVKKVVHISSAAVYGDTTTVPQTEEMVLNPQSPYAVTKLAGEYYCQVFQTVHGLRTACLRYFNVYGPRQNPNSQYAAVIPKFISMALEGKAPIIFGDGKQTRDFVFVKDAVTAAILAAESDATGVFNVGTGWAITVRELAELVVQVTGKDLTPVYMEARAGDIKHSLADISKAKTFGYTPKYTLEDGLKETAEYLQRQSERILATR